MAFFDCIKESVEDEAIFPPSFRATLTGDRACYLEKVKGVLSYDKERIELTVGDSRITLTGKELYLKKYCLGDLVVCGKITAIIIN